LKIFEFFFTSRWSHYPLPLKTTVTRETEPLENFDRAIYQDTTLPMSWLAVVLVSLKDGVTDTRSLNTFSNDVGEVMLPSSLGHQQGWHKPMRIPRNYRIASCLLNLTVDTFMDGSDTG
jgi:hypothetical protein